MNNNLSRRGFLGSLAAVGAAGVVSVPALAQTVKAPAKWDKTVDFLIVGTGFAGLGAAIEGIEEVSCLTEKEKEAFALGIRNAWENFY